MDFKVDPRTLLSNATQPATDKKTRDLDALRQSCREFETIYVMEMYKAMRKTVPEDGLFAQNVSTKIYTEMLDMESAKATTRGKGLGIGEAMYRQLADLIEKKK